LGRRELDKFGMAAALSRDRGFPDPNAFDRGLFPKHARV